MVGGDTGERLGEKAGLEPNNLLKVLQDGACSSKTMIDKGPNARSVQLNLNYFMDKALMIILI